MNDNKIIELAEDVSGLKVGMRSIEDKLDGLDRLLRGNGQPGFISDVNRRVGSLERYRAWVIGSAAGITGTVCVLAWIIMASK